MSARQNVILIDYLCNIVVEETECAVFFSYFFLSHLVVLCPRVIKQIIINNIKKIIMKII